MHFFSFFALACAGLQAASALPISNPVNDRVARDDLSTVFGVSSRDTQFLEARGKDEHVHPPLPTPYHGSAVAEHKANNDHHSVVKPITVKDIHRKVVEDHMKTISGEKHAKVHH
ncbi:hypothetical protein B0H34DRAFT_495520 [Crassisporium funariophilum]|nr:hypothetical protein B0H34DRAFT_495520 [Crassisporium funariophilum]